MTEAAHGDNARFNITLGKHLGKRRLSFHGPGGKAARGHTDINIRNIRFPLIQVAFLCFLNERGKTLL